MLIIAMILALFGVVSVLRSGALSGRALSADDVFNEGGFLLVVKHIFTHNPFAGYERDRRILLYGVLGLAMMVAALLIAVYFSWLMYLDFSR
jgi:hypothetical protein